MVKYIHNVCTMYVADSYQKNSRCYITGGHRIRPISMEYSVMCLVMEFMKDREPQSHVPYKQRGTLASRVWTRSCPWSMYICPWSRYKILASFQWKLVYSNQQKTYFDSQHIEPRLIPDIKTPFRRSRQLVECGSQHNSSSSTTAARHSSRLVRMPWTCTWGRLWSWKAVHRS